MHLLRSALLSFLCLGGLAFAQGSAPPATDGILTPLPGLSAPNVFGPVQQICMIRLPADPTGVFYTAMTMTNVPAAYGGLGGNSLITGRYDVHADTFTPNLDAVALNQSTSEFGMVIHPSGLYAVFDDPPGHPVLAGRSSLSAPFQRLGRLTGMTPQSWYDPGLATVNGQLHLICLDVFDLVMMPIDTTTLAVGTKTTLAYSQTGRWANSPTPIHDASGELIGCYFHQLDSSWNDQDLYACYDLDPATPAVLAFDATGFYTNGTCAGGSYISCEPRLQRVSKLDLTWCSGGRAAIAQNMEISAYVPPSAGGSQVSVLAMSLSFISPQALPGIRGYLGIDPSTFISLPLGTHDPGTGRASLTVPIPNQPGFSGVAVPAQAMVFDPATMAISFTNTCALSVL